MGKLLSKEEILRLVKEREDANFFEKRCYAVRICHKCGSELQESAITGWGKFYCLNESCPAINETIHAKKRKEVESHAMTRCCDTY